jgi:hypothetical protein
MRMYDLRPLTRKIPVFGQPFVANEHEEYVRFGTEYTKEK